MYNNTAKADALVELGDYLLVTDKDTPERRDARNMLAQRAAEYREVINRPCEEGWTIQDALDRAEIHEYDMHKAMRYFKKVYGL